MFRYLFQLLEAEFLMQRRTGMFVHRIEHGEMYIIDQLEDEHRDRHFEYWSTPEIHIYEICLRACDDYTDVTMDIRHIQRSVVYCSLVECQIVSDKEIEAPAAVLEFD